MANDNDKAPPEGEDKGAELEGGSYDVIRRRLVDKAKELETKADALNEKRKAVFGGSELSLIATERVRTENNCVPRDIVSIGGKLLFGYNVFIGLRNETVVADVFSLHRFAEGADGFDLSPLPLEGGFLGDPAFVKEFKDVYRYAKEVRLLQLRRTDTKLLAIFQIGSSLRDIKVFRWGIDKGGKVAYVDARGEEDNTPARAHDFEWTTTGRDDQVQGRHPHVSILDEVFVETVGGDLTVKVENNTEDGLGIYREPVDDPNQTLDDAEIAYAKLGTLILLRVRPYRESKTRYLVFNRRTRSVTRIDSIHEACRQLPEDQGIIFPGGYYLQTGDFKLFEGDTQGVRFERTIRSPNGEDVLYVFHRDEDGHYLLFSYNLIRKAVDKPIHCHGYSLFEDGRMIVFRATSDEPTRIHPMQVWKTPFTSAEHAAKAPTGGSYLAKVGNADLVRGISDAYTLRRLVEADDPTRQTYEDIIAAATRLGDAHYWLGHAEVGDLAASVLAIRKTAELIVDEFEKVAAIKKRATEALAEAVRAQETLLGEQRPEDHASVEAFMGALSALRKQRGHLITLRELRFMDLGRVDALEAEVTERFDATSRAAVSFLLRPAALKPLVDRLGELVGKIEAVSKSSELLQLAADLDQVGEGLSLLSEVMGALPIEDPTARTRILEGISEVYAQQNRARAVLAGRRRELSGAEGRAEFAAQFKLFGQSVTSALALCDTPERCDEQLSRLVVQLEELEGKFGEFDEFLTELADKREEVSEALGARRQALVDERQRRAQNLVSAAERILAGVGRRAKSFSSADDLNAYFASDPMVLKIKDLSAQLVALGQSVKADELESRLKTARQEAFRALRDRADMFEEGTSIIKLGRHRFHVNTQPLELTIVPRRDPDTGEEAMCLHLAGTDFYEVVDDAGFSATRDLWDQQLVSESNELYRGEFLAASILAAAEEGRGGLSTEGLMHAIPSPGGLLELVRGFAADKHDEGYERGVHDADAALILEKVLSLRSTAGLLRFPGRARALACLYWASLDDAARSLWQRRAHSLGRLSAVFDQSRPQVELGAEFEAPIAEVVKAYKLAAEPAEIASAARYLVLELAAERPRFVTRAAAVTLADALRAELERKGNRSAFDEDLRRLEKHPAERLHLCLSWMGAFAQKSERFAADAALAFEAAVLVATDRRLDREPSAASVEATVTGLLGQHGRITDRSMKLVLDEFEARLDAFVRERVPRYRAFKKARHELIEQNKKRLRLDEFMPRVLSSFVRNRLIDEVYLPLIGANLAKQLGAAGDGKRTDLMGMLLLISPPGYGKTTLMEYVANKLGLVFMKVNGPALGHEVTSIDPSDAPNATARQEVDKINLALEMSNNVMLYLDDIQHTNPELLQKFISLCDAQRKIEGVWKGRTRTYDLRGKKFCVVMAGNPYTESGDKFQIPDMLANRADTYNLGDILDGKEDLFASSYIENALTSNSALAPLAGREPGDVHKLIRMARGEQIPITELSYPYSSAEVAEITAVLERMFWAQKVLLDVNKQYILSASQEDAFRSEPPFKLQGSYRNMNKITEKVVAAHTRDEIEKLIDDHYAGESQTLTTGAEQNLLKLAEMRKRLSVEQAARWDEIKKAYARVKRMGGKDDDPVVRVTGTLSGLGTELEGIRLAIGEAVARAAAEAQKPKGEVQAVLDRIDALLKTVSQPKLDVRVERDAAIAELMAQQIAMVDRTLSPLAMMAAKSAESAGAVQEHLSALSAELRSLGERMAQGVVAAAGPAKFDAPLDMHSPSNFYLLRGAPGRDVIANGGLFVATFRQLPSVGNRVSIRVALSDGTTFDVTGEVVWGRASRGIEDRADAPPGFGAKLVEVPGEAWAIIARYVAMRPPFVHEG